MIRRLQILLLGLVLVVAAFSTGAPFLFFLLYLAILITGGAYVMTRFGLADLEAGYLLDRELRPDGVTTPRIGEAVARGLGIAQIEVLFGEGQVGANFDPGIALAHARPEHRQHHWKLDAPPGSAVQQLYRDEEVGGPPPRSFPGASTPHAAVETYAGGFETDADGWVVSVTPSGGWIPAFIAGETGIGLSQRMQSFVLDERMNPYNVVEPGKRPRVTLTPSLALKDGEPFLAFSVQGGDTQDQNLLQFFLNVVEFGMTVQEAVEAPNINSFQMRASFGQHEIQPGRLLLQEDTPPWVRDELRSMGEEIAADQATGNASPARNLRCSHQVRRRRHRHPR